MIGDHSHGQEDEGWQCNLGVRGLVLGVVPTKKGSVGKDLPPLGFFSLATEVNKSWLPAVLLPQCMRPSAKP